jgi:N-acetylgalactosamine-N,N'-diacetylbacillosaminyl-diphospho-undecaprenol 4-alpha-N-acetylgalactosaminyltransferase
MPRRKIAILINSLAGGGSERTVSHLLTGLGDKYELHLLLFHDEIAYDLPAEQIVEILGNDRSDHGSAWRNLLSVPALAVKLKKYCAVNEIDLVLSFLSRPNFAACLARLLGMRSKLLISERTYLPAFHRASGFAGKISAYLVKWLYPRANALLPNSEGTMRALHDVYGIRKPQTVVHNLLNLEQIDRLAMEEPSLEPGHMFTLIHVGSFTPVKRQRMIVDAFSHLENKDSSLLFIGEGPLLNSVRDRAAELGLRDRVVFLGHTANPFKYLKRADCFVFASDFEGFPNAMLEAMACGLPIISTDCLTGPRELIGPVRSPLDPNHELCRCGVLVPVGDTAGLAAAMAFMMTNSELRSSFASNAIERSKDFDKPKVLQEFAEILDGYLSAP